VLNVLREKKHSMHHVTNSKHCSNTTAQNSKPGLQHLTEWPQSSRKEFPKFYRLFNSQKLTVPWVIATKSRVMTANKFLEHFCTLESASGDICYNFSLRLHRIPGEFPKFSGF